MPCGFKGYGVRHVWNDETTVEVPVYTRDIKSLLMRLPGVTSPEVKRVLIRMEMEACASLPHPQVCPGLVINGVPAHTRCHLVLKGNTAPFPTKL